MTCWKDKMLNKIMNSIIDTKCPLIDCRREGGYITRQTDLKKEIFTGPSYNV